jgi:hypothetical protein
LIASVSLTLSYKKAQNTGSKKLHETHKYAYKYGTAQWLKLVSAKEGITATKKYTIIPNSVQ